MELAQAGLLWFSVLSFGVLGLLFLYDPVRWAGSLDIEALTDVGRVDLRATYGGGFLALGLFWFWCALEPARSSAALATARAVESAAAALCAATRGLSSDVAAARAQPH